MPETQTRVKPLNPAQVDVLRAVADGIKVTSNVTTGDVVSGTAAAALDKRGLVTRTPGKDGSVKVKITPAGRKALKAA